MVDLASTNHADLQRAATDKDLWDRKGGFLNPWGYPQLSSQNSTILVLKLLVLGIPKWESFWEPPFFLAPNVFTARV